jgi:hypothetical protein
MRSSIVFAFLISSPIWAISAPPIAFIQGDFLLDIVVESIAHPFLINSSKNLAHHAFANMSAAIFPTSAES